MYRFWKPIVEPLFERLDPRVIVEVGSDKGDNTRHLVDYARRTGAVLHVVDPLPKYDVDEWLAEYPGHLVFHRAPSLEVLASIAEPDVVLIDGDHNWHTVFNELKALEDARQSDAEYPVVIFHDVGWPYGRRDLYYEPNRIPSPDRQPHQQLGLRPGQRDLSSKGGLNAHLSNAEQEGGERNGVLTAIEDFMSETSIDLQFVIVPGINGFGLLYPKTLEEAAPAAATFVQELQAGAPLLEVLEIVEAARLEAQVESIDHQLESELLRRESVSREATLNERLDALAKEREAAMHAREAAIKERNAAQAETEFLRESHHELRASEKAAREGELAASLEAGQLRAEVSSLKARVTNSEAQTARLKRSYDRLQARRSVRFATKVASIATPIFKFRRRAKSTPTADSSATALASEGAPADQRDQTKLATQIAAQRPGSTLLHGPTVSIVILTRDGAAHMRRLLARLDDTTTFRSFEVIVVDNGSSDETAEVLEEPRSYPTRVIRNEHNTSFSVANNQGVAAANGELLLFLNNDIEPINAGWLGALVDAVSDDAVVAAGAVLVYPVRSRPDTDLTVQHAGIRFGFHHGAAHAFNVAAPDPLSPQLSGTFDVPAATAAAFMVKTEAFNSSGGFDEGYVYGTEDVDLNLNLAEHGRIVVCGQAVLFHHESATQSQLPASLTEMNRRANHQRFSEIWGPRLTRSLRRDMLDGVGRYTGAATSTVAITTTRDDPSSGYGDYYTAHELGDAFASAGWKVHYLERFEDRWYDAPADVDLVISLLDSFDVTRAPQGAFTLAWIRNWVERWVEHPWFGDYDLVVASSHKGAEAIAQTSQFAPPTLPLATNPGRFSPGEPVPTFESDFVFTGNNWGHSRDLMRHLDTRADERFRIYGKGWENEPRAGRFWMGSIEYELLPQVYRSAKIVLDDTAFPTLPYAFVNSRVFDALATGTLVLTNNSEGSTELFDGLLPSFTNSEELRTLLDQYLHDDAARIDLARQLREMVVSRHSYDRRPAEFLALALDHIEQPQCAIKIAVPNRDLMPQWGDTHFASALASALTTLGMPTKVHILPEWDLQANQSVDVVIHIRGLTNYTPKPSNLNVLWLVSHPSDVTRSECEKYDLVLVASRMYAERLAEQISVPVVFMPQATDHRRFQPVDPRKDLQTDLLFLGNSRNQLRPAVEWAVARDLPLTVYGGGWDGRIPARYLKADLFPNEQLANLYASSKVVLNDHWPDMRDNGFVSNRIFDVLASGGIVVSDPVAGLEELFADLVPTYSSPDDLERVVRDIMNDTARRAKIKEEGQTLVAKEHVFTRRAEQILELIRPMLGSRLADLEGRSLDTFQGDQRLAQSATGAGVS